MSGAVTIHQDIFGGFVYSTEHLKTLLYFRQYKFDEHKQILQITIRFSKLYTQHNLY